MSDFSDKVLRGEMPSDKDWNNHLIEAHRKAPSMTPHAFAQYRTKEGKNSYERLASAIDLAQPKPKLVVDLACGDGHLIPYILEKLGSEGSAIGIDMSEGELAIAKKNHSSSRVTFLKESAQKLSLPNNSADTILCHMALMLMSPIEPVVSEIARILKPGGSFAAVIGNKNDSDETFQKLQNEIQNFLHEEFPGAIAPKTGDPRVRSQEGLRELFNSKTGFSGNALVDDFDLNIDIKPEEIWTIFKDMYLVGMLSDEVQEKLKRRIVSVAESCKDRRGRLSFPFHMWHISVRK